MSRASSSAGRSLVALVLRRLLWMVPTTLGVVLVVFLLYHAAPGDPATVMIGMGSSELEGSADREARIRSFRIEHGLDRSLWVQLLTTIGPFNLLRDGHPWFSSPYGERRVERRVLEDGSVLVEGVPLRIEALPDTPPAVVRELDEAARRLRRDPSAAEGAREQLRKGEADAVAPLLSELHAALEDPDGYREGIAACSELLSAITGHRPALPATDLGSTPPVATVRHWFGWYYTAGGGARVRNSGERPWTGLLALDLGSEMQRKTPVLPELLRRLRVSVPLALAAVLLSYALAIPLGIFSARSRGTRRDGFITLVLYALYSVPTFWAGLMLILAFGASGPDWSFWPRLPVLGLHDKDAASLGPWAAAWDTLLHSILPVLTLSYGTLAYLSRQMRTGLLEVLEQDYIRTARAKGLSERAVIYKHALRNGLIPVLTLLASVLPVLIGGSIVVETVFDIQGMGKYAFEGLLRRDYAIIMATTVLVGVTTQLGILASDVAYSLVDPRIQHG